MSVSISTGRHNLLEDEGIVKFNEAHDAVMAVIEKHRVPVY